MNTFFPLAGLVAAIGGLLIATRILHTQRARTSNEHGKERQVQ
jgi:hypothetical protein